MGDDLAALATEYRMLAERHAATDFGDPASVRAGNAAADRLLLLGQQFAAAGARGRAVLASLLGPAAHPAAAWAAHHLLDETMALSLPGPLRRAAEHVLEGIARSAHANAAGERVWLEQYRARRPSWWARLRGP